MKNFKIYFIVILLLSYFSVSSQDVKLKLSDEIKIEKDKILTGLLHSDNSGYYMSFVERPKFFSLGQEMYIKKYNKKFKEVYSKVYEVGENNVYSLGLQYFKDKFVWVQYKLDKKKDLITYYAVPISLNGKPQKAKQIGKFKYKSRRDIPKVSWKITQDTTHMIFVAESDRNARKDEYGAYFSVINSDLDVVWDKKIKFKETQKQVEANSFELGPDKNVYFVSKIYDSNSSAGGFARTFSSKLEYDMYLVKISPEKTNKLKLDLDDKFIKGIKVAENQFGTEVNCTAVIGDSKNGPIQGLSYFTLDTQSGEINFAKKRNFSEKELDSFGKKNTSKDLKTKERGLDDEFIFRDIIYKEDGSFTALIEEYREVVRTSTDNNGNTQATTIFHNNHIIVANFDKDGNVGEISMIPKRYRENKSGYPATNPIYEEKTHYMFFTTLNTGDNIYYLYNDDEKNFKRNITDPDRYKVVTNFRECVAVIAHFDQNGELQRKELFKKEDTGTLLMPKFSTEINQNELFVFLKRRKLLGKNLFRFGILSVD